MQGSQEQSRRRSSGDTTPRNPLDQVGRWFTGAVSFAAVVAAFLGVTGGNVEQIILNHPVKLGISVCLLVVVTVIGALIPLLIQEDLPRSKTVGVLGGAAGLLILA